MDHLLLKAVTTAQDEGVFEAVISSAAVDRERDIVEPAAMVKALRKWAQTGKLIPLAWHHSTDAKDQIGHVDPASVREVDGEVVVKGWIDQSTEVGAHAWRLVKSGTLGFSFGYLIPEGGSTQRKGGGLHIKELDVFEITATPTPANNDTRVLGWKAMGASEMAAKMRAMADEMASENSPDPKQMATKMRAMADEMAGAGKGLTLDPGEAAGIEAGLLKAVWTTAYVNDLPDGAFLHIESGGEKDSEGKTTPRSLRHFPYKDASGAVDLPHLRNALARIPQSNLPQDVKDRLTVRAQRILDAQKSVDVTGKEPRARSVDPLRKQAESVALEHASAGLSLLKPPRQAEKARPELIPLRELKQRSRDLMLQLLSGEDNP